MKLCACRANMLPSVAILFGLAFANHGIAGAINFSGLITQSTSDGTGPAANNPSLNSIADMDNFLVTLTFAGSITAPGTYSLPGATLTFLDTSASVSETSFSSESFSVVSDGGFFDLSLQGCLSTGSGCLVGNSLSANFQIPSAGLNSANVMAQMVPNLFPPLDLLEDDGVTDIQGSINSYSYSGAPEPTTITAMTLGLIAMLSIKQQHRLRKFTRKP
jgi:hypothetical protein